MSGREHGHDGTLPHRAQAINSSARETEPLVAEAHGKDLQPTDDLEVVPGFERENLQGWIPQLASEADIRAVIEKAFDYRGDVTITRKDSAEITGYLFDRRSGPTLEDSSVRVMLVTGERKALTYSDIAAIVF